MSGASVIEAMLLRWGESPTGRTVTFLLPEDPGQHPFKGLRTGPSNGQRLALSVALIADDETTTPHEPPSQPSEKPASEGNGSGGDRLKGGRRARQAGIVCGEGAFKTYLKEKWHEFLVVTEMGEIDARETVHDICGVNSRALLDHDGLAARTWDDLHGKYIAWRDAP